MENEKITVEMLRRITEEKRAEAKRQEEKKIENLTNDILIQCKERAEQGYNQCNVYAEDIPCYFWKVTDKIKELGFNTKAFNKPLYVTISW